MTYLVKSSAIRKRRVRAQSGLSGFVSDFLDGVKYDLGIPSEIAYCLADANQYTADLDAKIGTLASSWNPSGYYTPDQIKALVASVMSVVTSAREAVAAASSRSGLSDSAQTNLQQSIDDLARGEARSQDYLTAAASSGGATIGAPGMKTWVLQTMNAASSAFVTAHVVTCEQPWWVSYVAKFLGIVGAAVNAIIKIVGVAIKVGEAVLNVAASGAELLGNLMPILKWGGLALVAFLGLREIQKYQRRS